ncbi:hypothetical protein [Rufibacter tibetensis]|uniref:Uncharacterized protein n=1 Tax=Rufibacter tibetensis TaxID=512763 RepID=A0A0P0CXJ1_9BACT|nr:hypothetical protein [Rufibacter tibetensis]ALJ00122.1 hypothetical protein DC20_15525 [Rufibacter tibetensis]
MELEQSIDMLLEILLNFVQNAEQEKVIKSEINNLINQAYTELGHYEARFHDQPVLLHAQIGVLEAKILVLNKKYREAALTTRSVLSAFIQENHKLFEIAPKYLIFEDGSGFVRLPEHTFSTIK